MTSAGSLLAAVTAATSYGAGLSLQSAEYTGSEDKITNKPPSLIQTAPSQQLTQPPVVAVAEWRAAANKGAMRPQKQQMLLNKEADGIFTSNLKSTTRC